MIRGLEAPVARRWARLGADALCPFRRGAWYPVLSIGQDEAVIEVRRRPVIVPRSALDLVATRPSATWAVIPRECGGPYLVCPNCAERVWRRHALAEVQCSRCDGVFRVEVGRPPLGMHAGRDRGGD